MPRRKRLTAMDYIDEALDRGVDVLVDRTADLFQTFKDRAMEQQRAKLPPEYLKGTFQCAACKREFHVEDMEQLHPTNGWGTCKGCYSFMFKAGKEKVKRFAKQQAQAGARRAADGAARAAAGFKAPPPPSGPPPWEVLGIGQNADVAEIKQAYRKLAMTYHPDRVQPGAPAHEREQAQQMFHAVQRAYDVMMKVRSAPTS